MSRAPEMRRARLEFTEAVARGVTIPELRRIKARERHGEIMARIDAARPEAAPIGAGAARWDAPWMMRD